MYRDEQVIAIDKPAGVPSQAADPAHDDDVVSRLKRYLAKERNVSADQVYLGVHQRLDRDTSGVMLYALQREANPGLARQFEAREIDKTYLAAVSGLPKLHGERVLRHVLARGRDGRMQVMRNAGAHGREAITRVRVSRRVGPRALAELGCDTGRTHQLRVQLAHEGAAIAGDRLYGGPPAMRLLLHAERLRLHHPVHGAELDLRAAPPLEFEHWLEHGAVDAAQDQALFERALRLAVEARHRLGRSQPQERATTALRLLHGVAEGTPELAVDLYEDFLVLHVFGELEADRERGILDALESLDPAGIYLKRHPRQKNELGEVGGSAWAPAAPVRGRAAPEELVVREYGLPLGVRLGDGLRTGLFLDQRDNRLRVRELANGKRVLNLFAYTGGFSVAALAGGAEQATCVDASAAALGWAKRNSARIGAADRHRVWQGDAFDALAHLHRRGECFDLIVVDPPSYSKTRSRRFVVRKDYAALCEAALRVLAPGGSLLACVNHHGTTQAKLRRDVMHAARALGRSISSAKDLRTQLDFPAPLGAEPQSKSVLLTCDAIRDSVPKSPTRDTGRGE